MAVLFVLHELRTPEPLIDLRLLLGPRLRWTLPAAFGGAFAIGGSALAAPLLVHTPRSLGVALAALLVAAAMRHGRTPARGGAPSAGLRSRTV